MCPPPPPPQFTVVFIHRYRGYTKSMELMTSYPFCIGGAGADLGFFSGNFIAQLAPTSHGKLHTLGIYWHLHQCKDLTQKAPGPLRSGTPTPAFIIWMFHCYLGNMHVTIVGAILVRPRPSTLKSGVWIIMVWNCALLTSWIYICFRFPSFS